MRPLFSLLLVLLFATPLLADDSCAIDRVDLRGPFGKARFTVEIADTPEAQQRGLMFRDHLPASSGMLFIYAAPGERGFWMMNTLIELDIIYLTPAGRVQFVRHRAQPGDLNSVSGGPGVQYVLEIRGGLARAMGIAPGTELRHPAIAPEIAAWPCNDG